MCKNGVNIRKFKANTEALTSISLLFTADYEAERVNIGYSQLTLSFYDLQ
jgi:hypothetical protein